MDFFSITLYVSLAVFAIGTLYRIWTWMGTAIGSDAAALSAGQRAGAALKGTLATIFSPRLLTLIKAVLLDAILQVKVAKTDFGRWLMHALIFFGFMALLLMHAMDEPISKNVFSNYESTLNPFFFLRNLLGLMVIVGVAIAIFRRMAIKSLRATTNAMDIYAIIILAIIMITGFLLDAVKIVSEPVFNEMALEYVGSDDPEETSPLQAYWAKEFGVIFAEPVDTTDEEELEYGLEMHEESCMDCHHKPDSLFISYPLAKIISPVAVGLNAMRADRILWYIHFLACFIGLAYLPFSRFFHIIASPISLIVADIAQKKRPSPAVAAVRRAMAVDACTHCGTCSQFCSVAPVFQLVGNKAILPSEKLIQVAKMAGGRLNDEDALAALSDGSFICTACLRCTTMCPSGIDLQDLWLASRQQMVEKGYPQPHVRIREQQAAAVADLMGDRQTPMTPPQATEGISLTGSDQASTFSSCFECQTCTNACPVVANFDNPGETLDLVPHQIMHAMGLGLTDMAEGARMIWDCVTCYKCQEQCPQGVMVTDIFYELKNRAFEKQTVSETESSASAA